MNDESDPDTIPAETDEDDGPGSRWGVPRWVVDALFFVAGVAFSAGIAWAAVRGDINRNTAVRKQHAIELAQIKDARSSDMAAIRSAIQGVKVSHGRRVSAAVSTIDGRLDALVQQVTEVGTSVGWMRSHYEAETMRLRNDVRDLLRTRERKGRTIP